MRGRELTEQGPFQWGFGIEDEQHQTSGKRGSVGCGSWGLFMRMQIGAVPGGRSELYRN